MAANTIPTVSTLPPAPTRADAPADFTTKADAFVAALPPLVTQVNGTVVAMNNLGSYLDQLKADVNGYKTAAAQSVTDAANQVTLATTQANNAQTSANQAAGFRDSAQAAAAAAQSSAGLPAISGKADQMLSVNAAGNGVEYRVSVPRPTAGVAGYAVIVNPAGNGFTTQMIPVAPVTKYFESTQQSITLDTISSVSHNLGVRPKFVGISIVCTVAEGGYSVGDYVEVSPATFQSSSGTSVGFQLFYDASVISVITSAAGVTIINKTARGNAAFQINPSRWKAIIRGLA